MKVYYASTGLGACLRVGTNIDAVERSILREVGTYNGVKFIREATEDDIAHVKAMGGYVPTIARRNGAK